MIIYEVVERDNRNWHTNGIAGITEFADRETAEAYLRTVRESQSPSQSVVLRQRKREDNA